MHPSLCLVALVASTSAASLLPWPFRSHSIGPYDSLPKPAYVTPNGFRMLKDGFRPAPDDVEDDLDGVDEEMETSTNNTLVRRDYRTKGSCTDKYLLLEWQYNWGVEHYCKRHWKPLGNEDDNVHLTVSTTSPETWFYQLRSYSGTIICWTYSITVARQGDVRAQWDVPYKKCVTKLKELLSEGKLGKNYCVVDGSEDVLFKKGEIKEPLQQQGGDYGTLVFASYRHSGKCEAVED